MIKKTDLIKLETTSHIQRQSVVLFSLLTADCYITCCLIRGFHCILSQYYDGKYTLGNKVHIPDQTQIS